MTDTFPARYWHRLKDGRIQCDLCPRDCKLQEAQRGACFVRQRMGDVMVLCAYGRSSGFCIDPIEKKPLNHFYPGTSVLSFGTAGCNLSCRFCQNWDISKSREFDRLSSQAMPENIADAAVQHGCQSVAFTYNDPVVFLEYAVDTAKACRLSGIKTVAVTAAYLHEAARQEFFSHMDATNVDLKSFSYDFYHKLCAGHLQPVLDTLLYICQQTSCWLEITTLLIPGKNDSDDEVKRLCHWLVQHLGCDVPLHFTAFHPDWHLRDVPATPLSTLQRARNIAMQEGLQFVYVGNVHDVQSDTTYCPNCKEALIVRDWYEILSYQLDEKGRCFACHTPLAGRFEHYAGGFGRKRVAVYF